MSFVGLYTGLSGVRAAQTGIDTTSNNVSNANTPGYTRQRVELRASHSYQSADGQLGTGVSIDSIARLRDSFLDDRFRGAVGRQAEAEVRAEFMESMESLSGEPDEGLTARFARLWAATEAWANDPDDAATRGQVITELHSISDGFDATTSSWAQLGADSADRRETVLDTANATLETIHDLNGRIANTEPSRIGPDLLDQRDLLLDELAQLVGTTSKVEADGSVSVELGTTDLLTENGPATLRLADGEVDGETVPDLTVEAVVPTADPDVATATEVTAAVSGELGGLHRVLTQDLPRVTTELDVLAERFVDAVNDLNAGGVLATGDAGGDLLTGDSAATIRVADGVTGESLAAAGPLEPPATEPAPHDGRNAREFAELRRTRLPDDDGSTMDAGLADLIVGLAGEVRSAHATSEAASGVATGAKLARAAEHGVSLDEEMVSLVRYQRALEASARVMTTVDQALDVLVNRVGIVGR